MKRLITIALLIGLSFPLARLLAQEKKPKIVLLIAEQNIEGPQRAWWASEIDLSTIEAKLAQKLIEQGYEVIEPLDVNGVIKMNPAFRLVNLSENQSAKLGSLSKADFVISGKAIVSAGGNVPHSNMRSCFANVTVKVISVKENKAIAHLDAAGNSAHLDVVTGGREALANAGEEVAVKIIDALKKEGGK